MFFGFNWFCSTIITQKAYLTKTATFSKMFLLSNFERKFTGQQMRHALLPLQCIQA